MGSRQHASSPQAEIQLQLEKPVVAAGQTLNGVVNLTAKKPLHAGEVLVRCTGT